jgi:exonuclease 3'-5' domain-containing protein 1
MFSFVPVIDSTFSVSESSLPYIFIDKIDETYYSAIQEIASNSVIAVDCEGVALGRNGKMCLLQIATAVNIFLFDVQALGASLFSNGLKPILEYHAPSKIFYDCRRDSDALFHLFGIRLKGVLDAALTEIFFRMVNGMGNPRYLKGYKKCVETYLVIDNPYFSKLKTQVSDMMTTHGTHFWELRPLPKEVLDYSAFDVFYLRHLHFALTMNMSNQNVRRIYGASSHFIRMIRDAEELVDNQHEYGSQMWAVVPSTLFNK